MEENFRYQNGDLYCEGVSISEISNRLGLSGGTTQENKLTPCYIYSRAQILANIQAYKTAFSDRPHRIAYSLKANYSPRLVQLIKDEGLSLVAVSGNEVRLALQSGLPGDEIFLYGNGKQDWELDLALQNNCYVNVDSVFDAVNIVASARRINKIAKVLIRLNPELDAGVHPYLSTGCASAKFGVPVGQLGEVLTVLTATHLVNLAGIQIHVGSTITDVSVFTAVYHTIRKIMAEHPISFKSVQILSLGGGLGIDYYHRPKGAKPPSPADLARAIPAHPQYQVMLEPGRSLVGNAGILVATVLGVKDTPHTKYIVVDAAMNDLIRPALYSAYHHVLPVRQPEVGEQLEVFDIVGPICESGDYLAKAVELPRPQKGDLLGILDIGAYCGAMASNYNMRPRAREIVVNGCCLDLAGKPESLADLLQRFSLT